MKEPLKVNFLDVSEIRMGSPYHICRLELKGLDLPFIEDLTEFQDIYSWSDDYKYLALVRWNTENNEPGFHLLIFDIKKKRVKETKRFEGCCSKVYFQNGVFNFKSFLPAGNQHGDVNPGVFLG